MNSLNTYNMAIAPDTRNHRGDFVRRTRYRFVEINEAGWAVICQDRATCHMVDPADLREIPDAVHS